MVRPCLRSTRTATDGRVSNCIERFSRLSLTRRPRQGPALSFFVIDGHLARRAAAQPSASRFDLSGPGVRHRLRIFQRNSRALFHARALLFDCKQEIAMKALVRSSAVLASLLSVVAGM